MNPFEQTHEADAPSASQHAIESKCGSTKLSGSNMTLNGVITAGSGVHVSGTAVKSSSVITARSHIAMLGNDVPLGGKPTARNFTDPSLLP